MNPVNCEVCFVHREYFAGTFALGNPDKRRVGKIHRTIGIFPQTFTDASQIDQAERQQLEGLPRKHLAQRFLGRREIV
jgi:hypothetical protein